MKQLRSRKVRHSFAEKMAASLDNPDSPVSEHSWDKLQYVHGTGLSPLGAQYWSLMTILQPPESGQSPLRRWNAAFW